MVSESTLCKCPYEVGDVLTTRNAADPATRWPGTSWSKITDRFILGAGGSYSVGATGGEVNHTLTVNEMPSHTHSLPSHMDGIVYHSINASVGSKLMQPAAGNGELYLYSSLASAGGSQSHNNMPPYIALYFWERIA